ncbi:MULTISPECIES: Bug family tripartite tricarboxylate transporter substrate binding protein [unclassified Paenibacillus]|uniref:Bug family tripartite tricarboxylate transporter substrate binding protein n=1 Tax=unclassified Paenibacillus TaxID=185978 RepID=UPI00363B9A2F
MLKAVTGKGFQVLLAGVLTLSLAACGSTGAGGAVSTGAKKESTASNYPTKPIVFVAPSGAGGAFDKAARSVIKILAEEKFVNQNMTVEVKPGGGGTVFMTDYAVNDTKNNYKFFVNSPSMLINNLKKDGGIPYSYKDTTPLAQLFRDYGIVAVAANSKYSDLKTLFNDLKSDPTKLTLAGGTGPGTVDHLTFIYPASKYGIDPKKIKYVSYDGKAQSMTALLGGNADILASTAAEVGEFLESGKIKVLAVNSPKRLSGVFKDVPTMKELGIDADFNIWRGVFGAKEMSADAKKFWDENLKKLSESDKWKKEMAANGWEADYKDSASFSKALDEQNKIIQDLLKVLEMGK